MIEFLEQRKVDMFRSLFRTEEGESARSKEDVERKVFVEKRKNEDLFFFKFGFES